MTCCALGDQDAILGHVAWRGDRKSPWLEYKPGWPGCQPDISIQWLSLHHSLETGLHRTPCPIFKRVLKMANGSRKRLEVRALRSEQRNGGSICEPRFSR